MHLLGAGHDTTANALAFCLGLLAQPAHADWQERAAHEAQAADAAAAEAKHRPIMAAAYRETLRLYPLGAVFSRVAGADATLRFGAGKRACVGAHFAELEASVALSRILRAFRLRLVRGDAAIEADLLFIMRPRQPLLAHLEAR